MRVALTTIACAVACLTATPLRGQTPARIPLGLDEAIARALERAPGVAEARARERASASRAVAGASVRKPSVTASGSFVRTNHVDEFSVVQPDGSRRVIFPDIPSNYRLRAEAMVPIYLAGRDRALVDAAEAEGRAAAAGRRSVEADVRLAVTSAYWQAVTSTDAVRVRERALSRTDAWVGDVAARVDVGLLPPNDVLSARAERARQMVQLIEARAAAAIAAAELAQLVGVDLDAAFDLTTPVSQAASLAVGLAGQPAASLAATAREHRGERD
ncbi:MAG TPA: TolC family protein, partial [Vicinamibacterales bacterium]|nr:TolC family protein [Vicinamibacterales bacterium]